VETLFKHIQDCVDYAEEGVVTSGPVHKIIVDYTKIFATGSFMSACRRWNEKEAADKIATYFKIHFVAAHRQHKQMQGKSAANSGYHSENTAVGQTEDHMAEATTGALEYLATAPVAYHGVVATLTEANARQARQMEDHSKEIKEVKALLKKVRAERRGKRPFTPSLDNWFWSHCYKVAKSHTIQSCIFPNYGHTHEAKKDNNMGRCQAHKE
jgi:hypothetical protein